MNKISALALFIIFVLASSQFTSGQTQQVDRQTDAVKARIGELEVELKAKSKLLGNSHPDIQALIQQINSWKRYAQQQPKKQDFRQPNAANAQSMIQQLKIDLKTKSRLLGVAHPDIQALKLQLKIWEQFVQLQGKQDVRQIDAANAQSMIRQLEAKLKLKKEKYGEKHPDVHALNNQINLLDLIFRRQESEEFALNQLEQELSLLKTEQKIKANFLDKTNPENLAIQNKVKKLTRTYQQLLKHHNWNLLFNGKDLTGWTQKNGTAKYKVVDESIMGTTAVGSPNSFLCSEKDYADFELRFDVKVHNDLNSGVQIRSRCKGDKAGNKKNGKPGRVFGPQVEIENSGLRGKEAGYIYGEATGRNWLTPAERLKPHKAMKDDDWNSFRILAIGPRIQTWINDKPIEDLTDEPILKTHPNGFVGLQVHGIPKDKGPFTVQWRNIRIREIKRNVPEEKKKQEK